MNENAVYFKVVCMVHVYVCYSECTVYGVCVHVLDGVIKADHNTLHCLVTTRQQDGILCLVGGPNRRASCEVSFQYVYRI